MDRASERGSDQSIMILVIPALLGTLVVLGLTFIAIGIAKRERKIKKRFSQARLRDPGLTRDEFERRGNLTRSRLLHEEELLRDAIIRKTQQDRDSGSKEAVAQEDQEHQHGPQDEEAAAAVRPTRTRSKTWHGRTRGLDVIDMDVEDGRQLLHEHEVETDWGSAQANVERTWQLLHGKKYPPLALDGSRSPSPPPPGGGGEVDGGGGDGTAPRRPPTVRLKTPPLLAHPVFKGPSAGLVLPPKHLSLPAELMRVQTEPGTVSSLTKM